MNRELFRFSHPIRVRYAEIDGQEIVFNAHYLTYVDVGIFEYCREVLGPAFREWAKAHVFDIALVRISLDFKTPARLDDLLQVCLRVTKLGRSSFAADVAIFRDSGNTEEVILTGEAVFVNYNPAVGRAQPIPEEIRRKILSYEGLDG